LVGVRRYSSASIPLFCWVTPSAEIKSHLRLISQAQTGAEEQRVSSVQEHPGGESLTAVAVRRRRSDRGLMWPGTGKPISHTQTTWVMRLVRFG
jgi:hypothetical protein